MDRKITIHKVTPDDLSALLIFSKKTFFDAFYQLNNPVDMEGYAARFFTPERTRLEFADPDSAFYFALIAGEIVGYVKLNHRNAQTEFQDEYALEIERIYVSCYHQNRGIGQFLLDFAVNNAQLNRLRYIWLGVWEKNHNAIRFYQRNGFEIFSQHDFLLGDDLQVDVLMKKMLL